VSCRSFAIAVAITSAVMTACSSGLPPGDGPGHSGKPAAPYAESGGRRYYLAGANLLLGGPVQAKLPPFEVQLGRALSVHSTAGTGSWPHAFSSDSSILVKTGDAGLGMFKAVGVGEAELLMRGALCALQPEPPGGCVVAIVAVVDHPVPTTAPLPHPTTSYLR